jgi:hypothetical protein
MDVPSADQEKVMDCMCKLARRLVHGGLCSFDQTASTVAGSAVFAKASSVMAQGVNQMHTWW